MVEYTTLVGVDLEHAEELWHVWPTWQRHASELLHAPLLLVYDDWSPHAIQPQDLFWTRQTHPDVTFWPLSSVLPRDYPRNHTATTQRERMLTGLVWAVKQIKTPWFLKLDTDTVAGPGGTFWRDEWCDRETVLIAPRWGYTKPGSWLDLLDRWADEVAGGNVKPPRRQSGGVAKSSRIISYAQWGRTDFAQECLGLLGRAARLPVPSQDTFLWYCAALLGRGVTRLRTHEIPWRHAGGNLARLEQLAREAVA